MRAESQALARVWNDLQLRQGSHIEFSLDRDVKRKPRRHPNHWSNSGILREAFTSLNRTSTEHIRQSHHEIDAMGVVSLAHRNAMRSLLSKEWSLVRDGSQKNQWLRVHKSFDETPMTMFLERYSIYLHLWLDIGRWCAHLAKAHLASSSVMKTTKN